MSQIQRLLIAASAFAGNYNIDNTTWNNWGVNGNWWSASTAGRNYNSNATGMNGPNTNTQNWFSVRCVQKYNIGLYSVLFS